MKRDWTTWLKINGMEADEHGNFDEDYGNIYSEDAQTRASEWFYQEFLAWQKKGDTNNG